jgi:hypothetical protein
VQSDARAEQFVVAPANAVELGGTGRSDEELLVVEGDEGLELGLCYSPALLDRLRHCRNPGDALDHDLDGYCQLTEGVSHFLYLVNTASQGRTVSLLELEAQAEIDKFATGVLHRWAMGLGHARELFSRLFERVRYRDGLAEPEVRRYREANRLAKNYCGRLLPHVGSRRLERLISELRYSYRLGAEAKLAYLATPPA